LRNEIGPFDAAIERSRSVQPGHCDRYDRGAMAARRTVGGDAVKSRPDTALNYPPGAKVAAVDLSEAWNLVRLATFVTVGSVAASLVIGVCRGGLDSILVSLAIAGAISLIFWMMSLIALTLILIPNIAIWLFRGVVRRLASNPGDGGGVADEWLDGPS
jgi:hypothetical protein